MEARAAEQARTQLTVTSVTSSSPYVDADLRNDGSTALADYDLMDVIVQYVTGSGAAHPGLDPLHEWPPGRQHLDRPEHHQRRLRAGHPQPG